MSQLVFPVIPKGATVVSNILSVEKRDGIVYYFHGVLPIFHHPEEDLSSFRMITSQLVDNGSCKQVDIVRAFAVTPISVKRSVKKFREEGAPSFFEKKPRTRTGTVFGAELLQKAQTLLDEGKSRSEIAETLKVRKDTLLKAIQTGRLIEHPQKKKKPS